MTKACVEFLLDGLVAPLTKIEQATANQVGWFDGGAYHSDGDVCQASLIQKPNHRHEPSPLGHTAPAHVKGHHVFGGMLQNEHFGHFIAENLARLWVFDYLGSEYTSLIFYVRRVGAPVAQFCTDTFSLLLPGIDVKVVNELTRFDSLAVPSELMLKGYIYGHPLVRLMCRRFRSLQAGSGPKKIFLSRSKLSRGEGGILGDWLIDEYLAAEGYTILYPEQMSIQEQISAYRDAEYLIFAEGSALHLYALVASPTQRVFVIWRRGVYKIFDWQIRSFGGMPVFGASCIERLWIPEHEAPDAAHGQAQISFGSLSKQLHDGGFISQALWSEPGESLIEDELAEVVAKRRRKFVLKPVPPR